MRAGRWPTGSPSSRTSVSRLRSKVSIEFHANEAAIRIDQTYIVGILRQTSFGPGRHRLYIRIEDSSVTIIVQMAKRSTYNALAL